jgi:hypothetical protein
MEESAALQGTQRQRGQAGFSGLGLAMYSASTAIPPQCKVFAIFLL